MFERVAMRDGLGFWSFARTISYPALPSAYLWPFLSADLVMLRSADGALEGFGSFPLKLARLYETRKVRKGLSKTHKTILKQFYSILPRNIVTFRIFLCRY